jgi:hypothetical protein
MALTYSELDAHVQGVLLPTLVDQVFVGDPTLARMTAKSKVMLKGGKQIEQPVSYAALSGGSYSGLDPFDIGYVETDTEAVFQWRSCYVNVTIPGDVLAKIEGAKGAIPILSSKMQTAEDTMGHLLSSMFFGDGTGNGGKDMDGFLNAINSTTYPSYGGISGATETWWVGQVNTDGGIVTPARVSDWIGSASIKNKKPDLIITTRALYQHLWTLVQPAQRFLASAKNADLASVGFTGIEIDNVPVLWDSHCPSGTMIGINTDYWKFYINKNKNFQWTPPKEPLNQDAYVRQLLLMANLFTTSRRMNFIATGLS